MGPPPRACLFMTPARVPMSVSLLLEHVHGDPCPRSSGASHVESSTTRCSATFAAATRGVPAKRRKPGPRRAAPRARRRGRMTTAPRGGPCGPPALRCLCRRFPPGGMCPAPRRPPRPTRRAARRPFTSGKARESTWSAGWLRGQGGASGTGLPGEDRSRPPAAPARAPGREPAVRRLTRPVHGVRPRRPGPVDGARRAGVSRCGCHLGGPPGPRCRRARRPTRLRDTGTARRGPIRRPRAAEPVVSGEGLGRQGNWPDLAATCS